MTPSKRKDCVAESLWRKEAGDGRRGLLLLGLLRDNLAILDHVDRRAVHARDSARFFCGASQRAADCS